MNKDKHENCVNNCITHGLPQKPRILGEVGVEVTAALASAAVVSPFVYVIDRSLMSSVGGKSTFRAGFVAGIKLMTTKPWKLVTDRQHRLPFAWMFALYGATYIVDNGVGRLMKFANHPAESVTPCPLSGHLHSKEELLTSHKGHDDTGTFVKFGATAFTNVLMCALKDKAYTQIFASGASRTMPKSTLALFMLRDSLTVASSFNLPDMAGHRLAMNNSSLNEKQWTTILQFLCPVTMQFLSSPIHIWAVDSHIQPGKSFQQRLKAVSRQYVTTSVARAARILPAFGLGGVCNSMFREWGLEKLSTYRYEQYLERFYYPRIQVAIT